MDDLQMEVPVMDSYWDVKNFVGSDMLHKCFEVFTVERAQCLKSGDIVWKKVASKNGFPLWGNIVGYQKKIISSIEVCGRSKVNLHFTGGGVEVVRIPARNERVFVLVDVTQANLLALMSEPIDGYLKRAGVIS